MVLQLNMLHDRKSQGNKGTTLLRMQPLGDGIGSDRAAGAIGPREKVHFFLEHLIDKLFIQ